MPAAECAAKRCMVHWLWALLQWALQKVAFCQSQEIARVWARAATARSSCVSYYVHILNATQNVLTPTQRSPPPTKIPLVTLPRSILMYDGRRQRRGLFLDGLERFRCEPQCKSTDREQRQVQSCKAAQLVRTDGGHPLGTRVVVDAREAVLALVLGNAQQERR